jgi:hypothetical protein|tara:strand:+ start:179 stop:367 length:189 start_codon:yes stop_codon:yes gene_type:complete
MEEFNMTDMKKQVTEKLLKSLDQAVIIDYVVERYSCEVIDILQDDIYDMVKDQAESWENDRD